MSNRYLEEHSYEIMILLAIVWGLLLSYAAYHGEIQAERVDCLIEASEREIQRSKQLIEDSERIRERSKQMVGATTTQ